MTTNRTAFLVGVVVGVVIGTPVFYLTYLSTWPH